MILTKYAAGDLISYAHLLKVEGQRLPKRYITVARIVDIKTEDGTAKYYVRSGSGVGYAWVPQADIRKRFVNVYIASPVRIWKDGDEKSFGGLVSMCEEFGLDVDGRIHALLDNQQQASIDLCDFELRPFYDAAMACGMALFQGPIREDNFNQIIL